MDIDVNVSAYELLDFDPSLVVKTKKGKHVYYLLDQPYPCGEYLKQWNKIIDNSFNVSDFYVGDDEDNIARNYAEIQSQKDNSDGVIIVMNSELLRGNLIDDYHGETRQIGQYIFNGNIKDAIHTVKNIETKKIILTYKDL